MLAKINWNPGLTEIRYFANTLALLAIVFAVVLASMGKVAPGLSLGAIGLLLAAICRLVPAAGRWVYIVWTAVTFVLSLIISPIVIAIIYYVVLTPIALVARLFGKDELQRTRRTGAASYFNKSSYDNSPDSFRRQF